jgi:uncharacterized protein (DUF849 family)
MGAGALHVHPYNREGAQSLVAADVAATIRAVRAACPGAALGITTIATAEPDPQRRVEYILGWSELPDFASVNFSEAGAEAVCRALLERGVAIEPGLASESDARRLIESGLAPHSLRILLEPEEQTLEAALANVAAIERVLDHAGVHAARLLHGMDTTAWPLVEEAIRRNLATRIGLEDTLQLPDGGLAPDNATLVVIACEIARRHKH